MTAAGVLIVAAAAVAAVPTRPARRRLRTLEMLRARVRKPGWCAVRAPQTRAAGRSAAELPFAAELLAAALEAGAPVDHAVAAVARVVSGPLGERLGRVARVLTLGGTAEQAWQELEAVPGAPRLVRAAVRSAEHGGALADACRRLAADLRADREAAVEAAARRAGVLLVLPLGLCFLPAFMLAGLVPVIVAVLGDVL